MSLKQSDLAIEMTPDRREGGQHVGLPKMTIKVTHKPTGITASCGCERSQMQNRNACLAMIEYGLAEIGYDL